MTNVGAIVHCRERGYLAARVELDEPRLRAFAGDVDLLAIREHLSALVAVATGGPAAGPIGLLPATDRFHWLVAPRSTVVQTSPTHAGLCQAPDAALEHLLARFVRR